AAAENQRAITVIRNEKIALNHGDAERRKSLMAHPRNVEMSFALAIQILLAQIAVPPLEHAREETKFIFFCKRGHYANRRRFIQTGRKTRSAIKTFVVAT